jgi:hypothetical protein
VSITKGKPAGAPASNQYGEFAVKYCSPAQARFIQRLLDERIHEFEIANAEQVNKKHASRIIEQLLACPKKVEDRISEKQSGYIDLLLQTRQKAQEKLTEITTHYSVDSYHQLTRDQAKVLITYLVMLPKLEVIIEATVGAYRVNETYYSVRKLRNSDRLFALEYDPINKSWTLNSKVLATLKATDRLSLTDASAFGIATGTCVHCHRTLTLQKSVVAGMGKWCASHYQ